MRSLSLWRIIWLSLSNGGQPSCHIFELGSQTGLAKVPLNSFWGCWISSFLWHCSATRIDSWWKIVQGTSFLPSQTGGSPVSLKIWSNSSKCLGRSSGETTASELALLSEDLKGAASIQASKRCVSVVWWLHTLWPKHAPMSTADRTNAVRTTMGAWRFDGLDWSIGSDYISIVCRVENPNVLFERMDWPRHLKVFHLWALKSQDDEEGLMPSDKRVCIISCSSLNCNQ